MPARHCATLVLAWGLLSGCSTINKSIEQRVVVSEQCRLATAQPPRDLAPPAAIASISLGNVGSCTTGAASRPLALCSLTLISTRYGLAHGPLKSSHAPAWENFADARMNLETALTTLSDVARRLDTTYQTHVGKLDGTSYADRTALLRDVSAIARDGGDALESVRIAQENLRVAMVALGGALELDAKAELAAWDSNLRIQLGQFERLLSGDVGLALQGNMRDRVLTHVARRSLELLHGSLKAADAVLNRLDDKAYGAVSIGYLAFGPSVQEGVNKAYDHLEKVYAKRQEAAGVRGEQAQRNTGTFMLELRRAACDNLVKGTQFSILSELVDTMLITKISSAFGHPSEQETHLRQQATAEGDQYPGTFVLASMPAQTSTVGVPDASPLSVYTVNAWTARQLLLTQKIAAKLATAARQDKPVNFPGIEAVDEEHVERLADAATAKTVDDAARLHPEMLNASDVNGDPYLASALNVTTAAYAVSTAAVTLNLNISVSNSNNFAPNNQNIIAPVINLPSSSESAQVPSLCAFIQPASAAMHCVKDGTAYAVIFDVPFRSDSCHAEDLERDLLSLGQRLGQYRDQHKVRFNAAIEGFASLPPARLALCPATSGSRVQCRFPNRLRESIEMQGCSPSMRDRNRILSGERARNSAAVIENASNGAVIVKALSARGTAIASLRSQPAPPEHDQTIVVRLLPLPDAH